MNETVTEKLTTEQIFEKYEHLASITLHKMFPNPNKFAQSQMLEYDDLLQFARLGLLKGINTYCEIKHKHLKYESFLIRNIKWLIPRYIYLYGAKFTLYKTKEATDDNKITLLSMNQNPYSNVDDVTFYDIVSQDNIYTFGSNFPNPESALISKSQADRIFDKLNEKEKKIVNLRLKQGLTMQEIGEKLGMSRQNISRIYKIIYEKYRDYLYAIAEEVKPHNESKRFF